MTDQETQENVRRIKESQDGARQYVLHPDDDDVFVRTGKQVISACKLDISIDLWMEEFRAMLQEVGNWSVERQDRIRACHCSPQGSKVVFFFSPTQEHFDFSLAGDLADLNVRLRNQFNVGTVEVHQIPWDESERFLNSGTARSVFGERFKTPSAMEA